MRVLAFMGVVVLAFGCGRANPLVDDDVESSSSSLTKGSAGAQNGDSDYCNDPNNLCADAEGDCDHNNQCQAGLICIPNQGADFGLARSVDLCLPAHCANRLQDDGESNVDCGVDVGCKVCATVRHIQGTPGAVPGSSDYCAVSSPCAAGGGDCDSDAECTMGLTCIPNIGAKYGFGASVDVCAPAHCKDRIADVDELGVDCGGSCAPCTGVSQLTTSLTLGQHGYCTASHPCGALLGDCDHDTDCQAGLSCIANMGGYVGLPSNVDVCMRATCHDRMLDGDETLADCGGSCPACQGAKGNPRATNGSPTYCSNAMNLCAAGEGNCTSDAQCANGLVCVNQRGASFNLGAGVNICLLATCNDGALNGNETAVDCGGACGACVSISGLNGGAQCNDNMQDGNETGVDCGGSCRPCNSPTCSDGIQNGGETGVDCGGTCLACPSCNDSIQNGSETGIDCGGSCVNACPSCTDGIQNGNETGLDCGGVCAACACTPNATQSCYSGPASTKNVGLCQAGTQVCMGDGSGWGACQGEVDPAAEDCSMGKDANCDGIISSCDVSQVVSAEMIGGTGDQLVRAVATDPATGNVYAVGYFTNQLVFPGHSQPFATAVGAHDIFVAEFDPTGAFLHAQVFGDKYDQFALTVAFDSFNSRVLVGGYFTGKMVLPDSTTLTSPTTGNQQDSFVIALATDLQHESGTSFSFGDPVKNQQAWSIDVDQATGDAYIGGYYRGTITLASHTTMTAGDWHAFVAKFDSTGPIWVNGWGSSTATGQMFLRSVVHDVTGVIIGVGYFNGTTTLTGAPQSTTGLTDNDGYVIAIEPSGGQAVFQAFYGGAGDQQIRKVAIDPDGNSATVGYFTVQFSGLTGAAFTADATAGYDSFVSYFVQSSQTYSGRQIGGRDGQFLDAISFSKSGAIRVAGEFNTELTVGTKTYTNAGGRDGFFGEFGADLNYHGGVAFGDANDQHVYAIASAKDESAWVGGSGAGSFAVGQYTLNSSGGQDGLLLHSNFGGDARVDLDANKGQLPDGGIAVAISEDGTYVAFFTVDALDAIHDTNGNYDVYVRNRTTGGVVLATIGNNGEQTTGGTDDIIGVQMTRDGHRVSFNTQAAFDPSDTNNSYDLYVFDCTSKTLQLASRNATGGNLPHGVVVSGAYSNAAMGEYGDAVAFATVDSLDPLADNSGNYANVYLCPVDGGGGCRNLITKVAGRGFLADKNTWQGLVYNESQAIIAFAMQNVPGDLWQFGDVGIYVVHQYGGALNRIDLDQNGVAQGAVSVSSISADGRFVAFTTTAALDPADTNALLDLYVRDIQTNRTLWASVPLAGHVGGIGDVENGTPEQVISSNGRFVVFASNADDFDANDTNGASDVFLRDMWLETTTLASVTTTTSSGNANSGFAAISGDGQFPLFTSEATNFTSGDTNGAVDSFVGLANTAATKPAIHIYGGPNSLHEYSGFTGLTYAELQVEPTDHIAVPCSASNANAGHSNSSGADFVPGHWYAQACPVEAVNDDAANGDRSFDMVFGAATGADPRYVGKSPVGTNKIHFNVTDSDDYTVDSMDAYRFFSQSAPGILLSQTGHYDLFASTDDLLVPGDNNDEGSGSAYDGFLRDRYTGSITRVNVGNNGKESRVGLAISDLSPLSVSADGHYVAFTSLDTSLVDGDRANVSKVFLRDVQSQTTIRISEAAGHTDPDADSLGPVVSGDGAFVYFTSKAANLVPGDTNGTFDIFQYDVANAVLTRIMSPGNTEPNGNSSAPFAVSFDHTKLLFGSDATTWTSISPNGIFQLYVMDIATGKSHMATQLHGVAANASLDGVSFSSDGNYVAFSTTADNLDPADVNSVDDVFVYDVTTDNLTRITHANAGSIVTGISTNAQTVLFTSAASDLPGAQGNGTTDAYLWTRSSNTTKLVSLDANGNHLPRGVAAAALSGDGNFLAISSVDDVMGNGLTGGVFTKGTDLAAALLASQPDGFSVLDNGTDSFTVTLSTQPSGVVTVTIDSSDHSLATTSPATITFTPDTWNIPQSVTVTAAASGSGAFNVTLTTSSTDPKYNALGTTNVAGELSNDPRVSTDSDNNQLGANSDQSDVSTGGRFVAFLCDKDIAKNDRNANVDVYLKDRTNSTLTLVSIGTSGEQILNGNLFTPSLSADGRYVAFATDAKLDSDDTNSQWDFYVFDTQSATLSLATRDGAGNAIPGGIFFGDAALSHDGTTIAFASKTKLDSRAKNGEYNVYVRNLQSGVVTLATTVAGRGLIGSNPRDKQGAVAINADGTVVAFLVDDAKDLWNLGGGVYAVTVATGEVERLDVDFSGNFVGPDAGNIVGISDDGRFVAFFTSDALDPGADTNTGWDVYVRDRWALRTQLVSSPLVAGVGEVNTDSSTSHHGMSSNGRFVVFQSSDDAYATSDGNGQNDVFVTDLWTGTVTLASTTAVNASGDGPSYGQAISPDGAYITFSSTADNFAANDTNGGADVFVGSINKPATQPAIYAVVAARPSAGFASLYSMEEFGGQLTGYFQIQTQPTADVTLPVFTADATIASVSPTSLTFTSGNWAQTQTAVVTAVNDDAANGDRSVVVGVHAATSADASYNNRLPVDDSTGTLKVLDSDDLTCPTLQPYARASSYDGGAAFALSFDGRFAVFASPDSMLVAGDTNGADDLFVRDRVTGKISRVNVRNDGTEGTNGVPASAPIAFSISADGRYVAFSSTDTDLVPCIAHTGSDVFLRDLQNGTTTRISESPTHANANDYSYYPLISSDGSTIVFSSAASNLVAGDTNNLYDVFTYNLVSGTLSRVLSPGHVEPDAHSFAWGVSSDGTKILLSSQGSTWSSLDTAGNEELYVVDVVHDTSQLVSVANGTTYAIDQSGEGFAGYASLSPDGNYVAFSTRANNLDLTDLNGTWDVFYYSIPDVSLTRVTRMNSVTGGSLYPTITQSGAEIAFMTDASDLPGADTQGATQAYVWNRTGDSFQREDFDINGVGVGADFVTISASGNFVGFGSPADPFEDGTGAGLFVHGFDVQPQVQFSTTQIQVAETGEYSNTTTFTASLTTQPSADVTITFAVDDPNAASVSPTTITFTPANWMVPQTVTVTGGNDATSGSAGFNITGSVSSTDSSYSGSSVPAIKGTLIDNSRVTTDENNHEYAIGAYGYVYADIQRNQPSAGMLPAISRDGQYVAFITDAPIDPSDSAPDTWNVYLKNRLTGSIENASIGSVDGRPTNGGDQAQRPAISNDGRIVGFTGGNRLTDNATPHKAQYYVYDRITKQVTLASMDSAGNALPSGVQYPYGALSGDGTTIVFPTTDQLDPAAHSRFPNLYVRNLVTGDVALVTKAAGTDFPDGEIMSMALNDDGSTVAWSGSSTTPWGFTFGAYARDMATSTIERLDVDGDGLGGGGPLSIGGPSINGSVVVEGISSDGRFVALLTTSALDGADTNGLPDVYIRDRAAGITTWASKPLNGHSGGVGDAGYGTQVMSANGRFVVFGAERKEFLPGAATSQRDIFIYDLWNDSSSLASVTPSTAPNDGNDDSYDPGISGDGQWVVFDSYASNLVGNDTNGVSDIFVGKANTAATTPSWWAVNSSSNLPEVGGVGRWLFQLQTQPAGSVTISATVDVNGSLSPATLTFTPTNWASTQTINVAAVDRGPGAGDVAINVSADGHSTDPNYDGWGLGGTLFQSLDSVDMTCETLEPYRGNTRSAYSPGGLSLSSHFKLSDDGNYELFVSDDSYLVPGDENGASDLFLRDRVTGSIQRINVAVDGTESATGLLSLLPDPNLNAFDVSADGRYVVFLSDSATMGDGDTSRSARVFVRDVVAQTTTRISESRDHSDPDDNSFDVSISDDGSTIAFSSVAGNLVPNDTNGVTDSFIYKVAAKTLTRVLAPGGVEPTAETRFASLNGDGTKLIFISTTDWATPAAGTSCASAVFWMDLAGGAIAAFAARDIHNGSQIVSAHLSADGNFVAIESYASSLEYYSSLPSLAVCTAQGPSTHIFLGDVEGQSVTEIVGPDERVNPMGEVFSHPHVSANGDLVAFMSSDDLQVMNDTNGANDAFVWQNGIISRQSLDASGNELPDGVRDIAFSSNGRFISFATSDDAIQTSTSGGIFTVGYKPQPGITEAPSASNTLLISEHAAWGNSQTISLRLDTQPKNDVTLTVSSNDPTRVTVTPTTVTLSAATWATPQLLTVTAVDNTDATGDFPFTITFSRTSSLDGNYDGLTLKNYHGFIVDDDNLSLASLWSDQAQGIATTGGNPLSEGDSSPSTLLGVSGDGSKIFFMGTTPGFQAAFGGDGAVDDIFVRNRITETTTRVQAPSGIGTSTFAAISGDGSVIVFVTPKQKLPADNNSGNDVYAYDITTGVLELISVDKNGKVGADNAFSPAISPDGRYVVFASDKDNLAPAAGGGNEKGGIFLRDRILHTTERISVSTTNVGATGDCYFPSISDDARYVLFSCKAANNLVTPAPGPAWNIFLRDRVARTTVAENLGHDNKLVKCDGSACAAKISGNGHFVVWAPDDAQLVDRRYAGQGVNVRAQVAIRDLGAGAGHVVSGPVDGTLPNDGIPLVGPAWFIQKGTPTFFDISSDGRMVAFISNANSLVPDQRGSGWDLFVFDRALNTMRLASVGDEGEVSQGKTTQVALSRDGEFVSFQSDDGSFPPAGAAPRVFERSTEKVHNQPRIWVDSAPVAYTTEAGLKAAFSISLITQPSANVTIPVVSDDVSEGTVSVSWLTFTPTNWNVPQVVTVTGIDDTLDDGDVLYEVRVGPSASADANYAKRSGVAHFVNIDNEGLLVASVDSSNVFVTGDNPALSADGRYVAFRVDDNQIYVRDTIAGTTASASVDLFGNPGNAHSWAPSLSGDGSHVAFYSRASNLVANDLNGTDDIFVHEMGGATTLASVAFDGSQANAGSYSPQISSDCSRVLFLSSATNLVPQATVAQQVFLRDVSNGTTAMVSLDASGNAICSGVQLARMSDDSRYVAFVAALAQCDVTEIDHLLKGRAISALSDLGVFVRDRQNGTTTLESIKRDGNSVVAEPLLVGNTMLDISADGRFVAYDALLGDSGNDSTQPNAVYITDTSVNTTRRITAVSTTTNRWSSFSNAHFSADGATLVFEGASANFDPQNTAAYNQVYAFDQRSDTLLALTDSVEGTLSDAGSASSTISANGLTVAFASTANFVNGPGDGSQQVYVMQPGALAPRAELWVAAGDDIRTFEDGRQKALFSMVLTKQPGADVTVNVSSSNTNEVTLEAASYTFTRVNWNVPQFVAMDGVDDGVSDGDQRVTISFSPAFSLDPHFSGLLASDVVVTNTDAQTAAIVSLASDNTQSDQLSYFGFYQNNSSDFADLNQQFGNSHPVSRDGRFVVFSSTASTLVPGIANGFTHIFVRDNVLGTTECADISPLTRVGGSGYAYDASISGDGRYVVYASAASDLVSNDINGGYDIFLYDRTTQHIELVTHDYTGAPIVGTHVVSPSVSDDGRFVAYVADANNIVSNDFNAVSDAFLWDRATRTTTLVSVGMSGNAAGLDWGFGASANLMISGDGHTVVFTSDADDLASGDTFGNADVFAFNVGTHAITRISNDSQGNAMTGNSWSPYISRDGQYIAFMSDGNVMNISSAPLHPQVFVYDAFANRMWYPGAGDYTTSRITLLAPSVTDDGRFVAVTAVHDGGMTLQSQILDRWLRTSIDASLADPTGNWQIYQGAGVVPNPYAVVISGDGRRVTYMTDDDDPNSPVNDGNGCTDVYVGDVHVY